jgi:Rod binding domain-containing protein
MSGEMAVTDLAQASIRSPAATANAVRAQAAAKEFEGVFISQMLGQMFSGVQTDETFGGGQGETMFRSLMIDQYGKQIASQGGLGLASTITAQLLKHQDAGGQQQTEAP